MAIEKLTSSEVAAIANMMEWLDTVPNPALKTVLIEVLVDSVIRLRDVQR